MGADHLINYRETPEWGRAVGEITADDDPSEDLCELAMMASR